ncbi:MAG: choline dehydrogenase [Gammaproteobacteria bacterium]|nr:choline dehydrogenase [Gammaproteobacteria bacterium]
MEADFVIIGSGSAGSALAYRLSADGQHKVLVLEHGGTDMGPLIQMPAALSYPMNMPLYDWGYQSEPEPHLNGRRLACPRGKVIGGSSSINGMVYVRGNRGDYQYWSESGATGWDYADVLPYFLRMETSHGGQTGWRGTDGPLHVTRGPRENPLYHAFVEAGVQAGFPRTDDYNGQHQEGFGPMEQTVWKGRRWSAANAYLRPALKRPNVSMLRCFARRVVIENGRATGVEIERGGKVSTIYARREVIVSASSINSPKLLMLSGIGAGEELQEHGIEVVANRPGVGKNLQDHLELYYQQQCLQPITLYSQLNLLSKARIGAQWLLNKSGEGATNHFESAAFLRSGENATYPDIQYHFIPVAIRYDGRSPVKDHGFQAHVGPMRSDSRGAVTLQSSDPNIAPRIQFNYMSTEKDWSDFRHCIRLTEKIFGQDAMKPFAGRRIAPPPDTQSDEALNEFITEAVESAYHPCGTCRMGSADDPMAVVDPECRVIGVDSLRVIDSSIFPRITNGNLNGPSIMTGEKGSDHVLGKKLPAIDPEQLAGAT